MILSYDGGVNLNVQLTDRYTQERDNNNIIKKQYSRCKTIYFNNLYFSPLLEHFKTANLNEQRSQGKHLY